MPLKFVIFKMFLNVWDELLIEILKDQLLNIFFGVILIDKKKIHKLLRRPSNEHSYQCKFGYNWPSGFREEDLKTDNTHFDTFKSLFFCMISINKKKQQKNKNYRGPSNELSY